MTAPDYDLTPITQARDALRAAIDAQTQCRDQLIQEIRKALDAKVPPMDVTRASGWSRAQITTIQRAAKISRGWPEGHPPRPRDEVSPA